MQKNSYFLNIYLAKFWETLGNFFQNFWIVLYEWFGSDDYSTVVWGSFLITTLLYWIAGFCYTVVDLTGKPAFILKYKIQDTSSYPVSFRQVLRVVIHVLINQVVVSIPFYVFCYQLMAWRGFDSGSTLPTLQRTLLELVFCILMEEIGFYYSHRFLHHPLLYKHIHKRHHEWTSPIAITAIYAHPIEHIFSNLLPPFLGPFLLGSHVVTYWLWFSIALLSTLNAHSGFHFPLFPSPEAHDFHHLKFNQNYGVLGILDQLHGTNSLFLQSKKYQRHIFSLSLVPLKVLYPDKSKKL
ncbi:fatty acid hydroxylase domain-containing protein 2 [Caerostris darwini]|uniref:Fatty acid hydroxylase domain-containing protein 2 n=1 Tax=Caerostris darwini TaxID=1538125 RepID=A0AAV4QI25_9ARAC|nr:fatty acid hydroxylase domain-containing protein 2 [Caerostris darwini]